MNKYLEKLAEMLSEENKQVAKTFAIQTAASAPAHIAGAAVGGSLGGKYLGGAASKLSSGFVRASGKLEGLGRAGKWVAKELPHNLSGGVLGAGIGIAAAGGLADLGALKSTLHGKVKE